MGYSIKSQNGLNAPYVVEMIATTEADKNEIDVTSIAPGSEVYVVETETTYILSNAYEWEIKEITGGGGGSTVTYTGGKNITVANRKINLNIPVIENSEESSVNNGLYFAEIASSTGGTGYATQEELNNLSQQVENMGSSIKTEQMFITDNTSDNISITNEQIKVSNGTAMTTITPTLITANSFSKYRIGNTVALPNTSGTLVVDTDLQEIYDRLAQIEAKLS